MRHHRLICFLLVLACLGSIPSVYAAESELQLATRSGVHLPVYYMKKTGASATVILIPGGGGGYGQIDQNGPTSKNFLVRTRTLFADAGFNVAVMGRPSDKDELDYADRIAPEHVQDIRALVQYLKTDAGLPVWLVGTSRGTVSATAAAIALGNEGLAGIVLTASVVHPKKTGAVPSQKLSSIHIPVLVVHHEEDGCKVCSPTGVPAILRGLDNAPVKKLIMVRGGDNPSGDPCKPLHYHGFIGIEKNTVETITQWIKHPQS